MMASVSSRTLRTPLRLSCPTFPPVTPAAAALLCWTTRERHHGTARRGTSLLLAPPLSAVATPAERSATVTAPHQPGLGSGMGTGNAIAPRPRALTILLAAARSAPAPTGGLKMAAPPLRALLTASLMAILLTRLPVILPMILPRVRPAGRAPGAPQRFLQGAAHGVAWIGRSLDATPTPAPTLTRRPLLHSLRANRRASDPGGPILL